MPYKDKEKQRNYQKNHNQRADQKERKREALEKKLGRKMKRRNNFYDLEIHHQLAMNSGIETSREWQECYQLGLFPDGICCTPQEHFKKPEDKQ